MSTALPLPPRLAALARAIGRGDYRGLRTLEPEVFAFARRLGILPAELIRSWRYGKSAEPSAPEPADDSDVDDRDDPDPDPDPDTDEDEDGEDADSKTCESCDGTGRDDEGGLCEECGGSGRVPTDEDEGADGDERTDDDTDSDDEDQ